ncbi:MAG: TIGR04348 family glycosyltransferase [Ramlibacter sp.]|nr:TIGR04348 family glycosyltransferase [Ramlibacter sp.]
MSRSSVVIVSPALAAANNGNWQTASRWAEALSSTSNVRITQQWPDADAGGDDVMLALHARRSADAVAAWAAARGPGRLAVVLTGTDLYQDIMQVGPATRSLELADVLVVLQELGADAVPAAVRTKVRVIFQSCRTQPPADKGNAELRAVMVGHLRQVKSPQTLFEAARLFKHCSDIRIDHIGAALEPPLGQQALATQRDCPGYRWLGALPHDETREQIRRAHLLINASEMEGGAHVVMEAVCSGTAVLASRIPGNVGMLGADYDGYFRLGDAPDLVALLRRCREGQNAGGVSARGLLPRLLAQCSLRAPLFAPDAEREALVRLVDDLNR